MRVFFHVTKEGSFAAAARRLDLDPPVVTRLVADLERHLGVPLLSRTTRRVALTSAGEKYAARLRDIIADVDEADAVARGEAAHPRGRLRILAISAAATHMIAPSAKSFLERFPEIQIDIHSFEAGVPPLEDDDLTFLSGSTPLPRDIVARTVVESDMGLYASPSYLRAHGVPKSPADLARHRILMPRINRGSVDRMCLQSIVGSGEELVEVKPAMIADALDTLLRATIDGLGVCSLVNAIVAPYVASGQLRQVLCRYVTGKASLVAAYPNRKFLTTAARTFLEHFLHPDRTAV